MTTAAAYRMRVLGVLAPIVMAACGGSEPDRKSADRRCAEVGATIPCACTDGREGEQVCGGDRVLGSCDCGPLAGMAGSSGGTKAQPGSAGKQAMGGDDDGPLGGAGMSGEVPQTGGANGSDAGAGSEAGAQPGSAGAGEGGEGAVSGGGPCTLGDVQGCRCPDYVLGRRDCNSGSFGECNCQVYRPEVLAPGCQPESCNQLDDDCDGLVDEQFICPDESVKHTQPFDRAIYLDGSTAPGSCGAVVLQRFWPTTAPTYIPGIGCTSDQTSFGELDDALYYENGRLYRKKAGPGGTEVPTPSCAGAVSLSFGFDSQGVIHYACNGILRRGEGEILTGSILRIVAVLADGRIIVLRDGPSVTTQYVVLSTEGEELVRFPPRDMFIGQVTPAAASATTAGDVAYLGLLRSYEENAVARSEIIVYRVDAGSSFRLVRRLPITAVGTISFLVVSDGTVFIRSTPNSNQTVTAHYPDNTSAVVWRTTDTPAVQPHGSRLLLAGPLEPVLEP